MDNFRSRPNGLQVVRALRASSDPTHPSRPIIMLTSQHNEQDIIEGLKASLDDYVITPFSLDELAARVPPRLWRAARSRGH